MSRILDSMDPPRAARITIVTNGNAVDLFVGNLHVALERSGARTLGQMLITHAEGRKHAEGFIEIPDPRAVRLSKACLACGADPDQHPNPDCKEYL